MVPTDIGLGLHDDEHFGPIAPRVDQRAPERPIQPTGTGEWAFPLEYRESLSEGDDFECEAAAAAQEPADSSQDNQDRLEHELTFYHGVTYSIGAGLSRPKSLILEIPISRFRDALTGPFVVRAVRATRIS
jgi:hypothetical protein